MVATWRLIQKFSAKRVLIASVVLLSVFLLACGVGTFQVYFFGAQSWGDAVYALSAPFFFGFCLIGFFGLRYIYNQRGSRDCLYGFLVVGVCYGGIEVLFQMCGGL